MGSLQVRKPTTEREERLITEDILVLGEATEFSKEVKAILGYSGIVAFDYTVQKAIFANLEDLVYLRQRHLSSALNFNHDPKPDTHFVTCANQKIQCQFEKQYGDRLIKVTINNMEPTYMLFEVPIQLPKKDISSDICAGMVTAQVSGFAYYKSQYFLYL